MAGHFSFSIINYPSMTVMYCTGRWLLSHYFILFFYFYVGCSKLCRTVAGEVAVKTKLIYCTEQMQIETKFIYSSSCFLMYKKVPNWNQIIEKCRSLHFLFLSNMNISKLWNIKNGSVSPFIWIKMWEK